MLKKYGKAIEQPSGTLPLHLHSEQLDGQSTDPKTRQARSLTCWALPYLQCWEGLHCFPSHFFQLDPSSPAPSMEWNVGCWERQSYSGDHSKEGLRSPGWRPQESLCSGGISSVLLGQPCCRMGQSSCPQRGWSPTHVDFLRSQRSGSPPWCLSLHPSWPPGPYEGNDLRWRGWAEGLCHTKKGYGQWDFRNKFNFGFLTFLTVKIKAGFQWLRSSDSC